MFAMFFVQLRIADRCDFTSIRIRTTFGGVELVSWIPPPLFFFFSWGGGGGHEIYLFLLFLTVLLMIVCSFLTKENSSDAFNFQLPLILVEIE
jgi:hypothetical protein